jgi:hypothetical protein
VYDVRRHLTNVGSWRENLNDTKYYSLSGKPMYYFQEQFYQVTTLDARVTEITNGLIVSILAKKIPQVIDLQEYARSDKAASVTGINKTKVIADFLNVMN